MIFLESEAIRVNMNPNDCKFHGRRILAIGLVAVLILSMTACTVKTQPEEPSAAVTTPSQTPEDTVAPANAPLVRAQRILSPDETFSVRDRATGELVDCTFEVRALDEWDSNLYLTAAGQEIAVVEIFSYLEEAKLLEFSDGSELVMFVLDEMSDDFYTCFCSVENGKPVLANEVYGSVTEIDLDGTAQLNLVVDVLGTWGAVRSYDLSSDGTMTPKPDSLYELIPYMPVEVGQAFRASFRDGGDWVEGTLEPGTQLYPTATDQESFCLFRTVDGREGKIEFTMVDYMMYVDGVSVDELFVSLPYAG